MATMANVLVGSATLSLKVAYDEVGYTEVGYTEGGVQFIIDTDLTDIDVDELTVSVDRIIIKERFRVESTLAEASLYNLTAAIPGASLAGATITLGGGVRQLIGMQLVGTNPAGAARTITIFKGTAVGTVSVPFKRGEKSMFPFAFEALKHEGEDVCTIVDA